MGDLGLTSRSGGLLGFDASLDTTYLDDGTDLTNVWAALVLSTGAGEFAVGAPRPLVDTMRVMPRFSTSRVLDLETGFFSRAADLAGEHQRQWPDAGHHLSSVVRQPDFRRRVSPSERR